MIAATTVVGCSADRRVASPAASSATMIEPASRPAGSPAGIVFLCDGSGTMFNHFADVQREVADAVRSLPDGAWFNVLIFTDGDRWVAGRRDQMLPATPENKTLIAGWLKRRYPGGTTDPRQAIEAAFAFNPREIYFLSDGQFYEMEDDVLSVFKAANARRKVPVHTVIFGPYEKDSTQAMRRIAGDSGGTAYQNRIPSQPH